MRVGESLPSNRSPQNSFTDPLLGEWSANLMSRCWLFVVGFSTAPWLGPGDIHPGTVVANGPRLGEVFFPDFIDGDTCDDFGDHHRDMASDFE